VSAVGSASARAALGLAAALWLLALVPQPGGLPDVTPRIPASGPERLLFGATLDLNRAEAASLEALPGIGPTRAAAIVAARCERGFARVGDLRRVPGIGARTLERVRASVSVSDAPARCVQ